jgi:hypothetical protein
MNDNKAMLMLDDTKWWSITEVFGVESGIECLSLVVPGKLSSGFASSVALLKVQINQ